MSWRIPTLSAATPPPRHPKRWQDVEELLDAGINVWTTVNVQHLESLNDLVYQTTGMRQRETLPDHVFDEADDIELIDLPPDDLIARLRAGKVYVARRRPVPRSSASSASRICMALREIALRRVADRVEAAARALPVGSHPARATPATGCWWRWGLTSRPSSWCAPASAWRMRSMRNGRSCTSRRRRC